MAIKRYFGQPLNIVVEFPSDPLVAYGLNYSDISEVAMNLKQNLATDTDTVFLQKLRSTNGVIVDEAENTFSMVLESTDYSNLTVGQTYFVVLAVETGGAGEFIEMDLDDNAVKITSDKNRA